MKLLVSGVSLRRSARILNLSRTTVDRKFRFLGTQANIKLKASNLANPRAAVVVFDDQKTFEHIKCKPLSITLAVEDGSRRTLGFEVSKMPTKGRLGLPQSLSHLNSKNAHGGGAVLNLLVQPRSRRRRRFRRRQPSIFSHTNFSISVRGWNASKSPFRGHEQF